MSTNGCPLASEPNPNAWAIASADMVRWRQVYEAERTESLRFCWPEDQANDRAHVTAWMDRLARQRRLRVNRSLVDDGRIARHWVVFLNDGEPIECGGYVEMADLQRRDTDWLYTKELLDNGWIRIEIMITDQFPDHEMFTRSDGSRVNLGFNGDHFYLIEVEIHQDDLIDNLKQ